VYKRQEVMQEPARTFVRVSFGRAGSLLSYRP